ncbi:Transposase (plasmid) [Rickettsia felis URRWXCal2]|uniref:Transposase n=1 Tax=Rickettsia felis (strain ATCC VR-1525 / URRWXCal2) TaxID=315456 RepID=Q4UJ95_RICFE|nr:Transposase [Rickettsia felis URRWXCal2]AAY62362.1 Transposase [Rickettsia felis URRWXCal2]
MDYSYNFISLEASNVLRDWLLEFSFIYEITKNRYCANYGRPSIDPVLFFRMQIISYLIW